MRSTRILKQNQMICRAIVRGLEVSRNEDELIDTVLYKFRSCRELTMPETEQLNGLASRAAAFLDEYETRLAYA